NAEQQLLCEQSSADPLFRWQNDQFNMGAAQQVQCKTAYVSLLFRSSSRRQASLVGKTMSSIWRSSASSLTSGVTGRLPETPVPKIERLPPHGIRSWAERGVCP